eukprot:gene17500-biopygen5012
MSRGGCLRRNRAGIEAADLTLRVGSALLKEERKKRGKEKGGKQLRFQLDSGREHLLVLQSLIQSRRAAVKGLQPTYEGNGVLDCGKNPLRI